MIWDLIDLTRLRAQTGGTLDKKAFPVRLPYHRQIDTSRDLLVCTQMSPE